VHSIVLWKKNRILTMSERVPQAHLKVCLGHLYNIIFKIIKNSSFHKNIHPNSTKIKYAHLHMITNNCTTFHLFSFYSFSSFGVHKNCWRTDKVKTIGCPHPRCKPKKKHILYYSISYLYHSDLSRYVSDCTVNMKFLWLVS